MENTTTTTCSQEKRLLQLETALESISDTLRDVKDLLRMSIQTDERIHVLQGDAKDKEKRLRAVERNQATSRWADRVVWIIVAAGITLLLKGII